MKTPQEGRQVRIFVGESDRWHHQPLYEAIVHKARAMHLCGATVLRGLMGFGAHSRMHSAKLLRLSEDLPIVIEIVDTRERIESFLTEIDAMMQEGLVTLEAVEVMMYRPGTKP